MTTSISHTERERYQRICETAATQYGVTTAELTPANLIDWLLGERPNLTPGGWRNKKSFVAKAMQALGEESQDEQMLSAARILRHPVRMIFSGREDRPVAARRQTSTVEAYDQIFQSRSAEFIRTLDDPDDTSTNTPDAFSRWLLTERYRWSRATWRLYRRACIAGLQNHARRESNEEQKARFEKAIAMLEETLGQPLVGHTNGKATSKGRAKSLTYEGYQAILDEAEAARGVWSFRAATLMSVSLPLGLRNAEWLDAEITADNRFLKVRNAKTNQLDTPAVNTEGRALVRAPTCIPGLPSDAYDAERDYRYIPLDLFGDPTALATQVRYHLAELRDWCKTELPDTYFHRCREALRRMRKRVTGLPKISPHTFRSQFSANIKSRFNDLQAVAYLMGHASDETASTHYGKRRYAWREGMLQNARKTFAPEQMFGMGDDSPHMSPTPSSE